MSRGSHRLDYVADFVRGAHDDLSEGIPDLLAGPWFGRAGEGTIFLSEDDAAAYLNCVSRLMDDYVTHEEMSQRSVESCLQDVLFTALDLQCRSRVPFEDRLAAAITDLHGRLVRPVEEYTCWVPIGGLGAEGLPSKLGPVGLAVMNETQLGHIYSPDGLTLSASERARRRRELKGLVTSADTWGDAVAIVRVRARDDAAANKLAHREARRAVDILNFFMEMVPYNNGWIYMPGEATTVTTCAPVLDADFTSHVPLSRSGPLLPCSLRSLKSTKALRPGLRRTQELMLQEPESSMAAVVLAAVQWAGRASVATTREQAFLLYAIALETLMLPEEERQGLTYRLRLRVARLLGRNRDERQELSLRVRDLYGVRSSIVHNGSYEVSEIDLSRMRLITKQCILSTLLHRRIRQITTPREFGEWFESKLLL